MTTLIIIILQAAYKSQSLHYCRLKQDHQILLSADGPHTNVLKFKPPMCFTKSNVDLVVGKLDDIFSEIEEDDELVNETPGDANTTDTDVYLHQDPTTSASSSSPTNKHVNGEKPDVSPPKRAKKAVNTSSK